MQYSWRDRAGLCQLLAPIFTLRLRPHGGLAGWGRNAVRGEPGYRYPASYLYKDLKPKRVFCRAKAPQTTIDLHARITVPSEGVASPAIRKAASHTQIIVNTPPMSTPDCHGSQERILLQAPGYRHNTLSGRVTMAAAKRRTCSCLLRL